MGFADILRGFFSAIFQRDFPTGFSGGFFNESFLRDFSTAFSAG